MHLLDQEMQPCNYCKDYNTTMVFDILGPPFNVVFSTSAYFVKAYTNIRWTNLVLYTLEQRRASHRLVEDVDFGKNIILSDEAHFDLGGYVNKQTFRIWDIENQLTYIEKPTHQKRITVWCGFWYRGIIGSFFFEKEQQVNFTVNGYW